jgi:hypothetical protein
MPRRPQSNRHLLVVLDVDHSLLPLASRDVALEQDVDLAVGSVLHLRHKEVCHDETEETSSSPDVSALSAKVGFLRFISKLFIVMVERGKPTSALSM